MSRRFQIAYITCIIFLLDYSRILMLNNPELLLWALVSPCRLQSVLEKGPISSFFFFFLP